MRVAVFGGSFHPPHAGHEAVVRWVLQSGTAEEVWLLPAFHHPLGKRLAPFEQRVLWCQALAEAIPCTRVCTVEEALPVPSYTIDSLRALARQHPEHTFRLVVGADILPETSRWKAWDAIEEDFTPIVVGREGHGPGRAAPSFPAISSTQLRRDLQSTAGPPAWASEGVRRSVGHWFRRVPLLRDPSLMGIPEVIHGYTTALGGAHGALDLGSGPSGPARKGDWRRTLDALDDRLDSKQVVLLDQVHEAGVLIEPKPAGVGAVSGVADAVVTAEEGKVLAIRTADCVPVLLAAPGGVGAAHAGWRGVASGVVGATVAALCELTGAAPSDLVVSVGPHISGAAYEVGSEVVEGIEAAGVPRDTFVLEGPSKAHVDLGAAVAAQLRASGVTQVHRMNRCTHDDLDLHSYRRSGAEAGRQAALIVRVPW